MKTSATLRANMDPGIRDAVTALRAAGVRTVQSCQGGAGHAYRRPTVDFITGDPSRDTYGPADFVEAWHIVRTAKGLGLDVRGLDLCRIIDGDALVGPVWSLVLNKPDEGYGYDPGRVLDVYVRGSAIVYEDEAIACQTVADAREFAHRILVACNSLATGPCHCCASSSCNRIGTHVKPCCPDCSGPSTHDFVAPTGSETEKERI